MTPEPVGALRNKAATVLGFTGITRTPPQNLPNGRDAYVYMITAPLDGRHRPKYEEAESTKINVATIPLFELRSIWLDGNPTGTKRHVRYEKFEIDTSGISKNLVYLGELAEYRTWLGEIENKAFKSLRAQQVYKANIQIDGNDSVCIVPCSEILNFYWKSNYLIKEALSGESATKTLFNADASRLNQNPPYIQLRKWVPDILVYHVARLALSDTALKRFNGIQSLSFMRIHKEFGASLCVVPPLEEKVIWEVELSKFGDVYFVSKIISCSGSFPFKNLIYGRDNDGRPDDERSEPRKTEERRRPFPREKKTTKYSPNKAPTEQIFVADILLDEEKCPFPALQDIHCSKIEKVITQDPDTQYLEVFEGELALEYVSASDPSSGARDGSILGGRANVHRRELVLEDDQIVGPDRSFNEFYEVISHLGSRGIQVSYRPIDQPAEAQIGALENILPYKDGEEVPSWALRPLTERKGSFYSTLKTYVLVKMSLGDSTVYIAEFMQRKNASVATILFGSNSIDLSIDQLRAQIRSYADKRSKWLHEPSDLVKKKFSHKPGESIGEWVERLSQKMSDISDGGKN
ncbi:MAG: hypothetical protein C9356_09200 [Oleiphilus sp.]|nr:MAG: hypothetical protein C9356_09200 [Oleiphilus sp.]